MGQNPHVAQPVWGVWRKLGPHLATFTCRTETRAVEVNGPDTVVPAYYETMDA